MSQNLKYALVTLGGCAAGAAIVLVVVLANPEADVPAGELVLITAGAVVLGGLLFFLRYFVKNRGQAAGRAMEGDG